LALTFALFVVAAFARAATTNLVEVIMVQGTVEVARGGPVGLGLASRNRPIGRLFPGDQIRTKERSRATIRLSI